MDNGQINLLNDIKDSLTEEELLEYKITEIENYINEHAINKIDLQAFYSNFFIEETTAGDFIKRSMIWLSLYIEKPFYTEEEIELTTQLAPLLKNSFEEWEKAENEISNKYKKYDDRKTREEILETYTNQLAPYREKYLKYEAFFYILGALGWIRYIEQTADYNLIISDIKSILDNAKIIDISKEKKEISIELELKRNYKTLANSREYDLIISPKDIALFCVPQYLALIYHNHLTSDAINLIQEKIIELKTNIGIEEKATTEEHFLTPGKSIIANDNISNKWRKGTLSIINTEHFFSMGNNQQFTTSVFLDNKNIQTSKEINEYDKGIFDTVMTMILEGKTILTPNTVYKAYTDSNRQPTEENYNKVKSSLDKQRYTAIKIDAKEEAEARDFNFKTLEGYLLPLEYIEDLEYKGQNIKHAYKVIGYSSLYTYAKAKNEIIYFDKKLLNAPLNKNEQTTILTRFLIHEIKIIINDNNNMSNNITFERIYKHFDMENKSKGEISKFRDKIFVILDYLAGIDGTGKTKKNIDYKPLIKSYKVNGKNKIKYHSITIIY